MKWWDRLGRVIGIIISPVIWVVIRFTTRTKVLVLYKNEALVAKGWLRVHNKWSLPGGGIKHSELPLPGALRELREETGLSLKASELQSLGIFRQTKGFHSTYHAFLVRLKSKPELPPRKGEINELQFLPISQLNTGNAEQHVIELLKRTPVA